MKLQSSWKPYDIIWLIIYIYISYANKTKCIQADDCLLQTEHSNSVSDYLNFIFKLFAVMGMWSDIIMFIKFYRFNVKVVIKSEKKEFCMAH